MLLLILLFLFFLMMPRPPRSTHRGKLFPYKTLFRSLKDAGISINDIDALIVATTTPDMIFPATATVVQSKLGGKDFPAWDIQAVCSGFVYGLAQADGMMRAGMFKRVLVIGAEAMSRIVNWKDRGTCILFGDGAGAVVLESRQQEGGIIGSVLHADGSYRDLLNAHHPHPQSSPELHHAAEDRKSVV